MKAPNGSVPFICLVAVRTNVVLRSCVNTDTDKSWGPCWFHYQRWIYGIWGGVRPAPWSRVTFIPFYSLVSWRVISIFCKHILEGTFHPLWRNPFVDGSLSHLSDGRTDIRGVFSFYSVARHAWRCFIFFCTHEGHRRHYISTICVLHTEKSSSEVFYLLTAYMEGFC